MQNPPSLSPGVPAPPSLTETEVKFRKALQDAICQRSVSYKRVFVVTIYFASDDTDAQTDSKEFARTMKSLLGLHNTDMIEIVLPDNVDTDSHWAVKHGELVSLSQSFQGRKLFILHFAGHGFLNQSKELILSGTHTGHTQEVPWADIDRFFLKPRSMNEAFGVIDIACILDCCHSGAFVRPTVASEGTVEVLAASDSRAITTGRKSENVEATFTQRFLLEMRTMVGRADKPHITLPDVLNALQQRKRDPTKSMPKYGMLYGSTPILLPVTTLQRPEQAPTSSSPRPHTLATWRRPQHSVGLKVHLPSGISDESTRTMVKWLLQLRDDFKVEVTSVNDTASTVIFLSVPYSQLYIFCRLEEAGVCRFERICENIFSENLLASFLEPSSPVSFPAFPVAG
ncbi:hypothetical protein TWF225_000403 [Orbilia oligospora]|nr:hypothetical protein TWF225_000403 [Orbilia oligospora]KAF3254139.1 hypothetical protein TWF128_006266 [Orbilia oligospora]KAF3272034.1 hypothetical protein TWF217_003851 [Orbilia oligospora]KAF3297800.1 hypothetical protein TWF132_006196 [Orbilia oligospora]